MANHTLTNDKILDYIDELLVVSQDFDFIGKTMSLPELTKDVNQEWHEKLRQAIDPTIGPKHQRMILALRFDQEDPLSVEWAIRIQFTHVLVGLVTMHDECEQISNELKALHESFSTIVERFALLKEEQGRFSALTGQYNLTSLSSDPDLAELLSSGAKADRACDDLKDRIIELASFNQQMEEGFNSVIWKAFGTRYLSYNEFKASQDYCRWAITNVTVMSKAIRLRKEIAPMVPCIAQVRVPYRDRDFTVTFDDITKHSIEASAAIGIREVADALAKLESAFSNTLKCAMDQILANSESSNAETPSATEAPSTEVAETPADLVE